MIYHYLLTRFNLALWIEDKNGAAIDREEWLKRRMALFETFCLPSVKIKAARISAGFCWWMQIRLLYIGRGLKLIVSFVLKSSLSELRLNILTSLLIYSVRW